MKVKLVSHMRSGSRGLENAEKMGDGGRRVPTRLEIREKEGNMNNTVPGREKGGKINSKSGKMGLGWEKDDKGARVCMWSSLLKITLHHYKFDTPSMLVCWKYV